MQLRAWLDAKEDRNIRQLAIKARTTRRVIYALLRGHVPRAETAKRIEEATAGEVTAAELLRLGCTKAA